MKKTELRAKFFKAKQKLLKNMGLLLKLYLMLAREKQELAVAWFGTKKNALT